MKQTEEKVKGGRKRTRSAMWMTLNIAAMPMR